MNRLIKRPGHFSYSSLPVVEIQPFMPMMFRFIDGRRQVVLPGRPMDPVPKGR